MTISKNIQDSNETNNSSLDHTRLQELRIRRASPVQGSRDAYADLKRSLTQRLNQDLNSNSINRQQSAIARAFLQERLEAIMAEENIVLKRDERRQLFESIVAETLGLGPLESLLGMDEITQIHVNGPKKIFIERYGQLEQTDVVFEDDAHIMRIIQRLAPLPTGQIDSQKAIIHSRLADGSQVHAILPPVALSGPVITIRRMSRIPFTAKKLIELQTLTPAVVEFLTACVKAKINIIVSGSADVGKTSLLNILCSFIPSNERIITIEDTAELQMPQVHVVRLETQMAPSGISQSLIRQDLITNALRMRPDRLVVGELQGSETLALIQAMNIGYSGSMTTVFADSIRDTLNRLEILALAGSKELGQLLVRRQIGSAIDLIIHVERLPDASRKVVAISEVQAVENDVVSTAEIFRFEQAAMDHGKVSGQLLATGLRPRFMWKLREAGINLPPAIFGTRNQAPLV